MSVVPVLTPRAHPVEEPQVLQKDPQEKDNCSICLLEMIDHTETACHHFFHEECLKPWLALKKTCPLCRYLLVKEPQQLAPSADRVYDIDLEVQMRMAFPCRGPTATMNSCG